MGEHLARLAAKPRFHVDAAARAALLAGHPGTGHHNIADDGDSYTDKARAELA